MMDKETKKLGNSIGGLLESLPLRERGLAIREIKILEEEYSSSLENQGDGPKLSLQLLRIEQARMVPRLMKWSNVPKNYGQAVVNFLACLPLSHRVQVLRKIHNIVSRFAIDSYKLTTRR